MSGDRDLMEQKYRKNVRPSQPIRLALYFQPKYFAQLQNIEPNVHQEAAYKNRKWIGTGFQHKVDHRHSTVLVKLIAKIPKPSRICFADFVAIIKRQKNAICSFIEPEMGYKFPFIAIDQKPTEWKPPTCSLLQLVT